MNLNTEQMVEAITSFQDSLEFVLSNYDQDNRIKAQAFCVELLMQEKPYLLVTTEGIQRAMQLTFTVPSRQDFIMTLSYVFFSRWGHSDEMFGGLVANLARGATQSGLQYSRPDGVSTQMRNEYRAVANAISERLTSFADAQALLEANQWLVVILMIQLSVTLSSVSDTK